MCRFVFYLGEPLAIEALVLRPRNSLVNQSLESRLGATRVNGDGFGIAWYAPERSPDPGVFRCIGPAWNDENLRQLGRLVVSPCILAHVRAASTGSVVSLANCHPFVSGRFAFMHNGDVAGFRRIRRSLLARLSDEAFAGIAGTTDSEYLFALFLDRFRDLGEGSSARSMAKALARAAGELLERVRADGIEEPSYLNVVVTDGSEAVALRATTGDPEHAMTLFHNAGHRYECEGDVCRMTEPGDRRGAVLIASEPLSREKGWEAVPPNSMVLVDRERRVQVVDPASLVA